MLLSGMSQQTSIEWVVEVARQNGGGGQTWNPLRGCSRISPGCKRCYAERIAGRYSKPHKSGKKGEFEGFAILNNGEAHWTGRVELLPDKLTEPLKRRKPTVYFISMSDLFHEKLSNEDIDQVFSVMALTPWHLYLILTKRAERMAEYLGNGQTLTRIEQAMDQPKWIKLPAGKSFRRWPETWPLPNVWLGVSVENQQYADERISHILRTPAAKRFVSYEPALGPVDFPSDVLGAERCGGGHVTRSSRIDWVIYGEESGPGARPAELDWFRSARDQCVAAGVPFFGKQTAINGRKRSMPELDGEVWNQVPIIAG